MWGYKRGELEAKNVSVLMPQPFSGKHNMYMRNYIGGGACPLGVVGWVRPALPPQPLSCHDCNRSINICAYTHINRQAQDPGQVA